MATRKQDIQLAIREMLKKYTNCPAEKILAGYNNHVQLPSDNDYIIFTVLNPRRYGTPRVITDENGNTSYQDFRCEVQIDFYGNFAFDRACDIVNISRTEFLCEFLSDYGVQPTFVDEAENLTGISGEKEYVERWMVRLEIDYRDAVSVSQDWFNTASLNKFETEF